MKFIGVFVLILLAAGVLRAFTFRRKK